MLNIGHKKYSCFNEPQFQSLVLFVYSFVFLAIPDHNGLCTVLQVHSSRPDIILHLEKKLHSNSGTYPFY